MKKIVTGALSLMLMIGAVQAQDVKQQKEHRKHQMEQLNLSADQKTKMQALRAEQKKAWTELKNNNQLSAEAKKKQQKALHQQSRERMKAVLTPEQQQQMAKYRAENRKEAKEKMHARRKAIKAELNLSQAQQEKMKTLNKDFKTKRDELRGNTALTEAQKKEQVKALAQQRRHEMKQVLTAEQQQKMETIRKEHRNRNGK